ncbi:transcriptional regulator [Duganella sp. BJB488]|uniref:toxin-antitoxin system TumE family protein n=1 Tax=unclassified Duganella TaxID=2636909 RepID=UPI000E357573|nr:MULTISPECIES: DUF6516 family protein [unclassified Duganella]RFP09232.1 transcriptional regulator [Duganella sp. BJB475]RFP13116.1 transcriptional regulator [Duganella sp. BJB489]RFP17120.1 transcriptional regulator [Duganella sp. BJB488]RFP25458.1 transcriptional regulator [Duganella sp. BJB476]RFP31661.1 transcriptional regulator [Duganella sp. BJB480]
MADRKIIDESHVITEKRGNGQLRREVWADAKGNISRYNLAYINHRIFQQDNGRVVGYDNAHDGHHRHYLGIVEPIEFTTFDNIEESFERDWTALQERK